MGSIPKYQQQKLASSVIGTPGVDTSGEKLGQSISQSAGQVTNTLYNIASKRQAIVNEAEAMRQYTDFTMQQDDLMNSLKEEYASNPRKAHEVMTSSSLSLTQNMAKNMNNHGSKQLFQQLAHGRIKQDTRSLSNWALSQESANAVNDYKSGIGNQVVMAANAPDTSALKEVIDGMRLSEVAVGRNVLGNASSEYTTASIEEAIQSFLENQALIDPKKAEEMLKDPVISKNYANKADLAKSIRQIGASNLIQQNLKAQVMRNENEARLNTTVVNNPNMSLTQKITAINHEKALGVVDREYATDTIEYLKSPDAQNAVTDKELLYKHLESLTNFSFASYEKNKGSKQAVTFLNDLKKIKQDILKDGTSGKLESTHVKKLLGILTSKAAMGDIYDALNVAGKGDWSYAGVCDDLEDAIKYFNKPEVFGSEGQNRFLASQIFFDRMMGIVEKNKRKYSDGLTLEEIQKTAQTIESEIKNNTRQDLLAKIQKRTQVPGSKYRLGQIIDTPKGKVQVEGFDIDGSPLINPVKE